MRKITLILVFCILAFGCSDDNSGNAGGDLKLSGTIMSPNHTFPISRAAVKVFKDGSVISQTTADALGHFEITNLPEGTLTVELSKGKFKKEVVIEMEADYELDMAERNLDIFPRIAVVTGSFDEIEQVGTVFCDRIPYGIRKHSAPAGKTGSPDDGINDLCGMSSHIGIG